METKAKAPLPDQRRTRSGSGAAKDVLREAAKSHGGYLLILSRRIPDGLNVTTRRASSVNSSPV